MPHSSSLPAEISPSNYIEKVSLLTGEVLDEPIRPEQLLVNQHRDYHLADIQARRFMSRVVAATGDEEKARQRMKEVRRLGHRTAELIARVTHQDKDKVSRALFGLKDREYYFRYKRNPLSKEEIEDRIDELQDRAAEQLAKVTADGRPVLRVLVTGGTGFVGQEILWQAAHDSAIVEVAVLIRPKQIKDRKTKKVIKTLSPAERGESLLDRLWLVEPRQREKFRFLAGDVEQPGMGIDPEERERLATTLTHVIHCAASVAFDDPYEASFRANVTGTVNALGFSHALQETPASPFVAHLAIETSYIHGRQVRKVAREDEVVFPKNFYNNYYELTKAVASIETERFMLEKDLRVVQLNPAIVIGESRAGNNRGDTKVVNAPINVFGRANEALRRPKGKWMERSKGAMLARMACIFPGDPSAEINLVPVDRVVAGILAALERPEAVGRRIHLATDNRITSEQIRDVVHEELGVKVKLAEPTYHRTITLPILSKVLTRLRQPRLARGLEKLGSIFAGYSEWGQPVHEVGNDVAVLGLPEPRPNTEHAFRMLCRHNRHVQHFGEVRDLDEISRRERIWWDFIVALERQKGRPAGSLPAEEFQQALEEHLDFGSAEDASEAPRS